MAKKSTTPKICFIRLLTGDDLIAEVLKKTTTQIVLKNPMQVLNHIEVEEGTQTLIMYPWLPQGIAMGNVAEVKNENIVFQSDVDPDILDHYNGIVEVAFATKPKVTASSARTATQLEESKGKNVISFSDKLSKSKKDLN